MISHIKDIFSIAGFFIALSLTVPTRAFSQDLTHDARADKAQTSCAPYKGRKLTLVLSLKPGGGFDLAARTLEPHLARHSGMSVQISHITGGQGLMALRTVMQANMSRPTIGLMDLNAVTTLLSKHPNQFQLSSLSGLGIVSIDHSLWVTRSAFDFLQTPPDRALISSSVTSPIIRLGMPGQLLNLNLKPVFGYEGTNEVWLALLRGEVDITTMSDQTFTRNAATGAQAKVAMTLTSQAHPDFPNTPYLAGPGGLIDLQTKKLPPKEHQQRMDRGHMAVLLSDQVRTLLTSSQMKPPMLACLRAATEAALFSPELANQAKQQKLALKPADANTAQSKLERIDQSLREHGTYFQQLVSAWKTNH